jgi:Cu/Ag efflux protein CusF
MKKLVALALVAAAVPALAGPSFAQADKKPAAPPAMTQTEKKPATTPAPAATKESMKDLAGEIVAMDQKAKTVTVKHMMSNKAAEMTFHVEDSALFTQFKAGDHVKVTYAEMGDKRVARTIVKG